MFGNHLGQFGEKTALVQGDTTISYTALDSRIGYLAAQLPQEKQLIALGIDNSIESITALLACWRGGHAVDPHNPTLYQRLRDTFHPHITMHPGNQFSAEPLESELEPSTIHPDLTLMLSTSGSTGQNKCVRLSQKNLQANAESIAQYLNITATDQAALVLPLHYSYGLSVLNSHLTQGACVHVGELSVTSHGFMEYLQHHQITSLAGVPYTFELLNRSSFFKHDFPNLEYVTYAGGRLAKDKVLACHEWALRANKKIYIMYGQTEATARMAYVPFESLANQADSIGIPIPGGKLSIKDENGELTNTPNVQGELIYQGPNVMMGYAESMSDLQLGQQESQLATGDLAYQDDHGFFHIVGRLKRFAKLYGKRFNLDDMERALEQTGYSCLCVSDDEQLYVVTATPPNEATRLFIESHYGVLGDHIQLIHMAQWPQLASGKLDYAQVLNHCQATHKPLKQTEAKIPSSPIKVMKHLLQRYQQRFNDSSISQTDSFMALGGDSLTFVALSIDVEETLGHLPANWAHMSIEALANTTQQQRTLPRVDTSIVLRAYAIVAVVAHHAYVMALEGGAVILLMLAGLSYSKFQFHTQLTSNPLNVLKQFAVNVLIPYWLVLGGFFALKGVDADISNFLLVGNLVGSEQLHLCFGNWFVQALAQCLVLFTAPLLVPSLRNWVKSRPEMYALFWLSMAIAMRLVDGWVLYGVYHDISGEQLSWVMWIFCLGFCIPLAKTDRSRWLLSGLLIALPWLFYGGDIPRALSGSIAGLLVLWVASIPMPKPLLTLIKIIGTSSMFIYMLHPRAPVDSFTADWSIDVIRIGLGIILGVVGYLGYSFIRKLVTGALAKI